MNIDKNRVFVLSHEILNYLIIDKKPFAVGRYQKSLDGLVIKTCLKKFKAYRLTKSKVPIASRWKISFVRLIKEFMFDHIF